MFFGRKGKKRGRRGKWRSFAGYADAMTLLYDIFLAGYGLLIRLAAGWNPKARAWVRGRSHPKKALSGLRRHPDEPVVWVHCASLGEFEQGRPLLEAIRESYPRHRILLTFFSPSGYETRKNYPRADLVCYLPLDGRKRSAAFLDQVRPSLAVFVKYEHWHHYLEGLRHRGIPALSASAVFRPSQPFFKPYGAFWRRMLAQYDHIFVQDAESLRLLDGIGLAGKAEISGDTRFDRVLSVAESPAKIPWLDAFIGGRPTLVAGSTWPDDERILSVLADRIPGLVIVVAPHEVDAAHLSDVERTFPGIVRFSDCRSAAEEGRREMPQSRYLLIDNIGLLSSLYRYASIAYIGGGFNRSGIHNILEAAVYGVPVLFGPRHERSREARELIDSGGAFPVADGEGLSARISFLLSHPEEHARLGRDNAAYVGSRQGATSAVMRHIAAKRLLSS
jgi:3-deoxy-D-manno-octulosonic-acid transferase